MKILAISGKMACGKSYIGKRLEEKGWTHLAFGDYVKAELIQNFSERTVWGKDPTARALRQAYGAARRQEEPDYWVNKFMTWLRLFMLRQREDARVVVDDVRYPNELEALRRFAEDNSEQVTLKTVRLERPGLDRRNMPGADHLSEVALDDEKGWDMVVDLAEAGMDQHDQLARAFDDEDWWSNG